MKKNHLTSLFLAVAVALALAPGLRAETKTWTGADDNLWTTDDNWDPGGAPGSDADIVFDGTGGNLNTIANDAFTLNSLTFTSGQTTAVTINATPTHNITFNPGTVLSVAAGEHKLLGTGTSDNNRDVVFTGTDRDDIYTFDIAGNASFEIQGRIGSEGGEFGRRAYTKEGAGTLILSGNSGGSGAWLFELGRFTISAGVLRIDHDRASGNSGNRYTVSSGAALELNANFGSFNGAQIVSGAGIGNTGVIRSLGGNLTFGASDSAGSLTLAADSVIGVDAGSLNIGLAIGESDGSHSLTKIGAGTLILSGSNTYTGATTISAGALEVRGSIAGSSGITNDGALVFNSAAAQIYGHAITGSGALTKLGGGVLTLSGVNTYSGGTTVSGGALSFLDTNAKPATGTHDFAAGTTLGLGVSGDNAFTTADIDNAFAGDMTGNLGNVTVAATTNIGIDTTNGSFAYGVAIIGDRGLAKLGGNDLTLTGTDNTYSGGTIVRDGTFAISSTGSLGASDTTVRRLTVTGDGVLLVDGGSAVFRGSASNDSNAMVIGHTDYSGGGNVTVQNGGSLTLNNGRLIIGAGVTANANNTDPAAVFSQTGGTTTIASGSNSFIGNVAPGSVDISGGTFTASTSSQFYLGVRANSTLTVSGTAAVTLGEIRFGWSAAGDGVTGTSVAVNLNGGTLAAPRVVVNHVGNRTHTFNFDGGTLKATGASATFFSPTLALAANVKSGGGTIDNAGFNIGIAQNLLEDPVSTGGGMTFKGSGTTTLTGDNTYTGSTTISAGILQIGDGAGAGTLGDNSDTFIASGAELRINRHSVTGNFGYSYAGELSGSGTVNVLDARRLNFVTNNQESSGDLSFVVDGELRINTGSGVTAVHLGDLSGSGSIQRAGGAPSSPPVTLITIGGKNTDSTFSGGITSIAEFGVEKVGTGTLTLEGNYGYGSGTTVTGGALLLNGNMTSTANAVTVKEDAAIGGIGTIAGDLTLEEGARFVFNPDAEGPLTVDGTLALHSSFGVDSLVVADWSLVDEKTYTLVSTSDGFWSIENWGIENAATLTDGRKAYFEGGSLNLVVIPEPGTAGLLAIFAAATLLRRRLRR